MYKRSVAILWIALLFCCCDNNDLSEELAGFDLARIEQIRSISSCQSPLPANTFHAREIIEDDSLIVHTDQAMVQFRGGASGGRWWGIRLGEGFRGWYILFARYTTSIPPEIYGSNSHLKANPQMLGAETMIFNYEDDGIPFTMYTPVEWYIRYTEPEGGMYRGEFWAALEYLAARDSGDARRPRIIYGCFSAS